MNNREFGPVVFCTFADKESYTHRPGSDGPFFCGLCGATNHTEV